jgi:4-hydroxy-tetrahydrodipicolinate synthase
MFEGLSVAMVTPFKNGAVDREAVARLVEHMVTGGVQGLVVSGSTGEPPRARWRSAANCGRS